MNTKADRAAFWLLKDINRAIRDFHMIEDGDRVAVAVSGGKDSLSLLRLLDLRRGECKEKYNLAVIHVIGDVRGPQIPAHTPLTEWLASAGYESQIVELELPEDEKLPLGCQRCTWNRRKTLFNTAHELGCNVVAFGHHADDLAQTTLLNLLNYGKVETMAPVRSYFDGSIRLIRPLCYIEENEVRKFAGLCGFPSPPPDCPQSNHSRRNLARELLRTAEKGCPAARTNLVRAGLRGNKDWTEKDKDFRGDR